MSSINWKEIFCQLKDFIKMSVKKYTLFVLRLSPHQNLLQGIVMYTFLGWIVLSLPFMKTQSVGWLDTI